MPPAVPWDADWGPHSADQWPNTLAFCHGQEQLQLAAVFSLERRFGASVMLQFGPMHRISEQTRHVRAQGHVGS